MEGEETWTWAEEAWTSSVLDWSEKVQASPTDLNSGFQAASVLQKIVRAGRVRDCVGCVNFRAAEGRQGWASSHFFIDLIDWERIFWEELDLSSKISLFQEVQRFQVIQGKEFPTIPKRGRFFQLYDIWRALAKVVYGVGVKIEVHGLRDHTSCAKEQWKNMCSWVSGAPQRRHKVFVSIPLFCKLSLVDIELWSTFHIKNFNFEALIFPIPILRLQPWKRFCFNWCQCKVPWLGRVGSWLLEMPHKRIRSIQETWSKVIDPS